MNSYAQARAARCCRGASADPAIGTVGPADDPLMIVARRVVSPAADGAKSAQESGGYAANAGNDGWQVGVW